MKRSMVSVVAALVFMAGGALPLMAQQARVSPHETISAVIDGNRVTIVYGRPYSKDPKSGEKRAIWGKLVPYGQVWRMGSDEATTLITQQPLMFGDTLVPAGAYTLDMQPEADGKAKLIINKSLGHWGIPYTPALVATELARVDMKKEAAAKEADQFTITIDKGTPA